MQTLTYRPVYPSNTSDFKDRGIIYCITNTMNNMNYIGQTRCFKKRGNKYVWSAHHDRLQKHLYNASVGSQDCFRLYNAMRSYPKSSFMVYILEVCEVKDINKRERYWIKRLRTRWKNRGYNIARGGQRHRRKRKRR